MMSAPPPGALVKSFTPLPINVTPGSSTRVGRIVRIGRFIETQALITSAASFAVTGGIGLYLPVQSEVWLVARSHVVNYYRDVSPNTYCPGFSAGALTTTIGSSNAKNAAGTYVSGTTTSSTIPFTWSTGGDVIGHAIRGLATPP